MQLRSTNPLDGIFGGLGLGSTLDLGNLLSFLNPGDLLAMLNLDGLSADIGSLLPGALPLDAVADLLSGILSLGLILGLLRL